MRKLQLLTATALFGLSAATNATAQAADEDAQYSSEATAAHADMAIMLEDSLYNNEGDEIGTVEGIVLGDEPRLIVSVGEFLGIGGKNVLVPASELAARAEGGFNVSYTEEQLQAMAEYENDDDVFDFEDDDDDVVDGNDDEVGDEY